MGQQGDRPRSWWEKALFRGRRGDSRSSHQALRQEIDAAYPFHTPRSGSYGISYLREYLHFSKAVLLLLLNPF